MTKVTSFAPAAPLEEASAIVEVCNESLRAGRSGPRSVEGKEIKGELNDQGSRLSHSLQRWQRRAGARQLPLPPTHPKRLAGLQVSKLRPSQPSTWVLQRTHGHLHPLSLLLCRPCHHPKRLVGGVEVVEVAEEEATLARVEATMAREGAATTLEDEAEVRTITGVEAEAGEGRTLNREEVHRTEDVDRLGPRPVALQALHRLKGLVRLLPRRPHPSLCPTLSSRRPTTRSLLRSVVNRRRRPDGAATLSQLLSLRRPSRGRRPAGPAKPLLNLPSPHPLLHLTSRRRRAGPMENQLRHHI